MNFTLKERQDIIKLFKAYDKSMEENSSSDGLNELMNIYIYFRDSYEDYIRFLRDEFLKDRKLMQTKRLRK